MSSKELPSKARTVVLGAGIVGNSLIYHLTEQGRDDIVQIDKGPLPDPGGSTGHASNFLMPLEHSKEMAFLTDDSIEQYDEMDQFTLSEGIEVARTEERLDEMERQLASAKSWGQEGEIISTEEVKEKVPYINEDVIKGGLYQPGAGTCDPLRAGEIMRERARENADNYEVFPNTEVLDLHVEGGEIQSVETDRGTIEADEVVIAAGLWSNHLAKMAGTHIPLYPAAHQLISVGPIERFEEKEGEIAYPIVRDVDTQMYERMHGNDLEVGSYQHRPLLYDIDDILSIDEAPLSPTQPPLTEDAFEKSMEDALELMPEILDDPGAGIRHEIDGLLSVTPDGAPAVGPMHDVDGLWACSAIWIKEAPAFGKNVAQWMTRGYPEVDLQGANVNRFVQYGSDTFVKNRGAEGYEKIYGIVHPAEQWQTSREMRTSAFYSRQQELDARFFEAGGWERPRWYWSNDDLTRKYRNEIKHLLRGNEWDSRWWSPIILGEHLHMRDHVGMIGDTGFGILDVQGPSATEFMEKMHVGRADVDVGKTVYTPVLAENGGFLSDLTFARLGENHYRIITGGAHAGADLQWYRSNAPDDVVVSDMSEAFCTLGVWGPEARNVVDSVTDEDMSHEAFPPYTAQHITIGEVNAWAMRLSYVGELGWEIYAPMGQGQNLWDTIAEAGEEYNIRPVGTGVYGATGRMEKGYRLIGHELELEYNASEAGLSFHGVKEADFIGKEAYAEALEEEDVAKLCTLTVDDHTSSTGERRFMLGHEPVLDMDGNVLVDEEGRRSYVTSAATGPSVGKHILLAYIPAEHAEEGNQLQVEYMGEHYPVTVEVVGSRPLFDPKNERIRS